MIEIRKKKYNIYCKCLISNNIIWYIEKKILKEQAIKIVKNNINNEDLISIEVRDNKEDPYRKMKIKKFKT